MALLGSCSRGGVQASAQKVLVRGDSEDLVDVRKTCAALSKTLGRKRSDRVHPAASPSAAGVAAVGLGAVLELR